MKFLVVVLFAALAVAAAFPTPEDEEARRDKRSGLWVAGVAPAATVAVHAAPWVAAHVVHPPVISTTVVGAHHVVVPHVVPHVLVG